MVLRHLSIDRARCTFPGCPLVQQADDMIDVASHHRPINNPGSKLDQSGKWMAIPVKGIDLMASGIVRAKDDHGFPKTQGHGVFAHLPETLFVLGEVKYHLRRLHHEALYNAFVLVVLGGAKCWIEIADVMFGQCRRVEDLLTRARHATEILASTHRCCDIDVEVVTQRQIYPGIFQGVDPRFLKRAPLARVQGHNFIFALEDSRRILKHQFKELLLILALCEGFGLGSQRLRRYRHALGLKGAKAFKCELDVVCVSKRPFGLIGLAGHLGDQVAVIVGNRIWSCHFATGRDAVLVNALFGEESADFLE